MPSPFDSARQGFYGQSGRFWKIDWNGIVIGGCQSVTYNDHTGVRGFVGEIGSDHKEPDFDMRQISGTVSRLTLNKKRIRDLFFGGDASDIEIDFRDYQFTLTNTYLATASEAAAAGPTNAAGPGPYKEVLYGVMFTDLSFSLGGPYELSRESVSFIGLTVGTPGPSESPLGR